jgi:putative tryptophan/tyrosine transport system substrate-binding protein
MEDTTMMRRTIGFLVTLALGLLMAVPAAAAQQPGNVYRIGLLFGSSQAPREQHAYEAFQQGLRELGYVEGKNVILEYRSMEGNVALLPALAAELVRLNVDIMVTSAVGYAGVLAAKQATTTIPIVMGGLGADPVATGLIASLARPGGNLTGFTNLATETAGKRLELFKATVPTLVHVAVLYDAANPGNVLHAQAVQTAGRALGLTVQLQEVRGPDDFERVFAALREERPDGLYVPGGPLMRGHETRIVDFALKSGIPSVHDSKEAVEAGGLVSYAYDIVDHYRRLAYYVDKILKGTRPADLPVERPTKFELVLNLKTAQQIGLTVPPAVLYQADKVIK